jgi:hypothetical protein
MVSWFGGLLLLGPSLEIFSKGMSSARRILLSASVRLCRAVDAKMIVFIRASVCVWDGSNGATHFFSLLYLNIVPNIIYWNMVLQKLIHNWEHGLHKLIHSLNYGGHK